MSEKPYDWWVNWEQGYENGHKCWYLKAPSGKNAATVWDNFVWHTWDEQGNGGENYSEKSLIEAMRQAMASVLVQGHHTSDGGSRIPVPEV